MNQFDRWRPADQTTLLVMLSMVAATIAVLSTVAAITLWIGQDRQGKRIAAQSAQVAGVVRQIQVERERNIRDMCEASNARNRSTIATLDQVIAARAQTATRGQRRTLAAYRASTFALIEALAPRGDCDAVVRSQIETPRSIRRRKPR